jgi:hypothetical protein
LPEIWSAATHESSSTWYDFSIVPLLS